MAPFPDVVSDDGFVHRCFAPEERRVSARASSVVRPTTTFGASLGRRVRVRQGNEQLDAMGLPRPEGRLRLGSLVDHVRRRTISPVDAGWYLALLAAERLQLRWRTVRGVEMSWGTDVSSRRPTASVLGGR